MSSVSNIVSNSWRQGIFENKVLFCTGGSGDICGAQVKAVVYLGANACIIGRNKEKAERVAAAIAAIRPGARVLGIGNIDVRSTEDLGRAAAQCARELGGIDFVIAGAAGNFLSPLLQLSTNAFRSVLEIDLFGAWNTQKVTVPYLMDSAKRHGSGGGRIIFISSTTQYTGTQLVTHGSVAKSGIDALSAQLSIELGPRGVRSNVIAPGPIAGTEGVRRLIESESENPAKEIPLSRFGTLKDMSDAAVYLLCDASDYVSGSVLVVDGSAWRTGAAKPGVGFAYPETILSDKSFRELAKASRL